MHVHPLGALWDWEQLPEKRLFALTANGKAEYRQDNPTRYLLGEPDPETGITQHVATYRKPVCPWLCREEREER